MVRLDVPGVSVPPLPRAVIRGVPDAWLPLAPAPDKVALVIGEIACSILDPIPEARHAATHNDILRCNIGIFQMRDFREVLARRFEANSKIFLHRPERGRLALA
jgi:hypothetical protein